MERLEMDVLMIRVHACMNSGRYAEARRLLEAVLTEEPAHGVAHGMMGWILWALVEDHERALEHFRCAVRWAPHFVNSWKHYLNLLAGDGHEQELHEACARALHVPGIDRAEVHAIVARYLERSGRPEQAMDAFRRARDQAVTDAARNEHRAAVRRLRARRRRAFWS
ncbi:MAG: tetratricopeptide repeat protein [Flavobacteriales bacterium]|nr:tetratricopeptide repeat protein [Flavobacteriales bacterium]